MSESPNVSFPAKVTALLYERFKQGKKGLVFLPVELIENNGDELKNALLNMPSFGIWKTIYKLYQ